MVIHILVESRIPQKNEIHNLLPQDKTAQPLKNPKARKKAILPPIYDEWKELLAKTRYTVDSVGHLCYKKFHADGGTEDVPLANFLARPVREIYFDDGRSVDMRFEIEGLLAGGILLPAAKVPAKDFSSMSWVAASWGLGANIEPGTGAKDKVRHAIQCLAWGIERQTIYTHLGWRKIDGSWVYLHAGGAVGADNIQVDPGEGLTRYILPEQSIQSDMEWSIKLLDVSKPEITLPLFAMTYLAPLCEPLRQAGIEPAFILWLYGQTGARKSTIAALFLSHFGDSNEKSPPASFKDTENGLEKKGFLAKDTLLLVDDYHPTADKQHANKMLKIAQELLRAYGDRIGRTRMRADTSLREGFPPRGLCLVTGEDIPEGGQSTSARLLTLEMSAGDINMDVLNNCQRHKKELAVAMRGYLSWLANQLDELIPILKTNFLELRQEAYVEGQHGRLPEAVAWLTIGLRMGLEYAVRTGTMSDKDKNTLLSSGWNIFKELSEQQAMRITEDKPVTKFIQVLKELIASGQVCTKYIGLVAGEEDMITAKPDGFIGWQDNNWYYLLPEVTYKYVAQFCTAQGGHFSVTARTLWKYLDTEGLIFTERARNETRRMVKQSIPGVGRPRVLMLKKDALK